MKVLMSSSKVNALYSHIQKLEKEILVKNKTVRLLLASGQLTEEALRKASELAGYLDIIKKDK